MKNFTLVSWLGGQYIESFNPNCCIINRVLSFLKIDFKPHIFVMSSDLKQINTHMTQIPLLINNGESLKGLYDITCFLKKEYKWSNLFSTNECDLVTEQHLLEWSLNTMRASVIYFSYVDVTGHSNMKKLLKSTIKSNEISLDDFDNEIASIRKALSSSIKSHEINSLSIEKAMDRLDNQFLYISNILGSKLYIFGDELHFIDIVLFCHFNRLLLPGMAPSKSLRQKHYRLIKWLERVGVSTQSEHNIYPSHLQL